MNKARLRSVRSRLLNWYGGAARDLPWRASDDPYAIWVSEIMLQQTRVGTVIPYYHRFLERFPTIQELAAATEEEVLSVWSGLGYYRRARSLRAGARAVIRDHGGALPADVRKLKAIPGIGRYTAGAVASIAFRISEPILDGNIRRVLARLTAGRIRGDRSAGDEAACWEMAASLVEGEAPGDLNQALMELGAMVCTPSEPGCGSCPLAQQCEGYAAGVQEQFPAPAQRPATVKVEAAVALILRGGRVLLESPGARSPLRGLWDLPAVEHDTGRDGGLSLKRSLQRRYGIVVRALAQGGALTHGIMNRRIRLTVYRGTLARGGVTGNQGLRWVDSARLEDEAVSGATIKVLEAARP